MAEGDPADLRLIVVFLRSIRRWTQEEFSRASGVDRGLISDYELGDKAPSSKTLARLAAGAGPLLLCRNPPAGLPGDPPHRGGGWPPSAGPVEGPDLAPPEFAYPDFAHPVGEGLDRAILKATLPRLTPYLMELTALVSRKTEDDGE